MSCLCYCLNHVLPKHLRRRFANQFHLRMWTGHFHESHLTSSKHNQLNLPLYNKEYHQHTLSSTSSCPLALVLPIAPILPEICWLKLVPMPNPLQHRHSEHKYCHGMQSGRFLYIGLKALSFNLFVISVVTSFFSYILFSLISIISSSRTFVKSDFTSNETSRWSLGICSFLILSTKYFTCFWWNTLTHLMGTTIRLSISINNKLQCRCLIQWV